MVPLNPITSCSTYGQAYLTLNLAIAFVIRSFPYIPHRPSINHMYLLNFFLLLLPDVQNLPISIPRDTCQKWQGHFMYFRALIPGKPTPRVLPYLKHQYNVFGLYSDTRWVSISEFLRTNFRHFVKIILKNEYSVTNSFFL